MSFFTEGERIFLDTIRDASPEDDAPHLVFADWLEEHGECARAELIRVHVAGTRMPHAYPQKEALSRRWRDLLQRHGSAWVMALPQFPGVRWEFDRGVPGRAVVQWRPKFQTPVNDILTQSLVYQLIINERATFFATGGTTRDPLEELAKVPNLGQLQYLFLDNNVTWLSSHTARLLADSPGFRSLRSLRFHLLDADSQAVRILRETFGSRLQVDNARSNA